MILWQEATCSQLPLVILLFLSIWRAELCDADPIQHSKLRTAKGRAGHSFVAGVHGNDSTAERVTSWGFTLCVKTCFSDKKDVASR